MSLSEIKIARLDGTPDLLTALDGKAALLVNVASKCGLTPQYTALEELQKSYADKGFTVMGFPCNQFAGQEPGSAEEIAEFCSTSYGVTFPISEKIDVNGAQRHPLFTKLTAAPDTEGYTGDVRWNFEKFLVDKSGNVVARFAPQMTPNDPAVVAAIESAIG
ncbi:MAG: glutathione peroxidase [Acidimicrobiia bacterium]